MAFRDGRIRLTQKLDREVYPGKIWFFVEPRLGRDMTDSTDWDLIFPITKEKLNAARRTFI